MGKRRSKTQQAPRQKKEINPTILAAIISAMALVIVAIINLFGPLVGPVARLAIEAAQTAEAQFTTIALTTAASVLPNAGTFTPSPPSEFLPLTFEPITTEALTTPESDSISRGLRMKCFDAIYWTPKNSIAMPKDSNNCWVLNEWYMQPQEEGFKIFTDLTSKGIAYWVNTPLSGDGRISFTINIKDFQTVDNYWGDFVFGFGKQSEDFLAGKFLVYRVIKSGSRIYIHFGDPNSHSATPIPYIQEYIKDSDQKVLFVVEDLSLDIYLNGEKVMDPISLSVDEHQLFWIGYRLPQNGLLNTTISNFEITEINP